MAFKSGYLIMNGRDISNTYDMPEPFPIIGHYDKQKFIQFNPEDNASWYIAASKNGKNKVAMYPCAGRRHIRFLNQNRLVFSTEPRGLFKSIKYYYVVDGNKIYQIDRLFNQILISGSDVTTNSTNVFFAKLVVGTIVFACFVDTQNLYIYREDTQQFFVVTDPNIIGKKPSFIAAFGNRLVVAFEDSSQFNLSVVNLDGGSFDPATCFGGSGGGIFAQETAYIRQLAVFKNILYIFTDNTTGIWANIPSVFNGNVPPVTFPFKKNTSYEWDYGINDALSLSVGFSRMTWLGQNEDGLVQVLNSTGDNPVPISTKAIELLFQKDAKNENLSPFVELDAIGFLYQLDNTVLFRLSAGIFQNLGIVDYQEQANSIEYNFEIDEWHRVIETNGQRNRIQRHIYFDNRHLVTLQGDTTIYEMSDQFYTNESTNPNAENPQVDDAYNIDPFRYERVTPIIREPDDGEFITDWVQIDFVWGEEGFIRSTSPFQNAKFIIDEVPDGDGNPVFIVDDQNPNKFLITEDSNFPQPNELTYNNFYKPHIELYWSDDGGVYFYPADVLEFSQIGYYQWRMRWYQLGISRNRCYKLICVSPSPIVVLGGQMLKRRVSGGAC